MLRMNAREYIKALERASTAEDVIALWRSAAKPNELSLKEIVSVHKACGQIVFDALSYISSQENYDEEETRY
jgi:hypothetical protein